MYDWTILILSSLVAIEFSLIVVLLLVWRNAARQKDKRFGREDQKYRQIFTHLKRVFRRRTGLSNYLVRAVNGQQPTSHYPRQSAAYLQALVNDVRDLCSAYTSYSCCVSIKLLIPQESGPPLVRTAFRDEVNSASRLASYGDYEPFEIMHHSLLAELINSEPTQSFLHCNDLKRNRPNYKNPNPNWKKLFNASAVMMIADPEVATDTGELHGYGFLMVDNTRGGFDDETFRDILSIVASSAYYVISAADAIERSKEADSA